MTYEVETNECLVAMTEDQRAAVQWMMSGRDMNNLVAQQSDVRLIGDVAMVRQYMLLKGINKADGMFWHSYDITLINTLGEQSQVMRKSTLEQPGTPCQFEDLFPTNEYE